MLNWYSLQELTVHWGDCFQVPLVFQMVSDRVESSHMLYLLFISMGRNCLNLAWDVFGVICLQELSVMQMTLLFWLHVLQL